MEINDFLSIGIVGVALSLVMEWIKAKFETSPFGSKVLVLGLSLAIGAVFYFLNGTVYWQAFIGVLGTATVVWAFLLNNGK